MSDPQDAGAAQRRARIAEAVAGVRGVIALAAGRMGRDPADVTLVAVTKTHPIQDVLAAARAGVLDFGENHAVDLATKAAATAAPRAEGMTERVRWHFHGRLQSGTVRHVADAADIVHSAEPGGAIERLARRRSAVGRAVDVLIQVDLTGERQGVRPDDVDRFADSLVLMPGLRLVGLMTIPPITADPERAREHFVRLRELSERLRTVHPEARELSMGMSFDYQVAVEEGATMVRVGTALFGQRRPGA
jgi:pyridoxal phosphate enzyme (YggS family)